MDAADIKFIKIALTIIMFETGFMIGLMLTQIAKG